MEPHRDETQPPKGKPILSTTFATGSSFPRDRGSHPLPVIVEGNEEIDKNGLVFGKSTSMQQQIALLRLQMDQYRATQRAPVTITPTTGVKPAYSFPKDPVDLTTQVPAPVTAIPPPVQCSMPTILDFPQNIRDSSRLDNTHGVILNQRACQRAPCQCNSLAHPHNRKSNPLSQR